MHFFTWVNADDDREREVLFVRASKKLTDSRSKNSWFSFEVRGSEWWHKSWPKAKSAQRGCYAEHNGRFSFLGPQERRVSTFVLWGLVGLRRYRAHETRAVSTNFEKFSCNATVQMMKWERKICKSAMMAKTDFWQRCWRLEALFEENRRGSL